MEFSLSKKENEYQQFIIYFICAIQDSIENFGEEVLELVQATVPPSVDELAELLVNDLAELEETLYLALDDYHLIRNSEIHQFISKLFEYQQPFFKLIIITRRDPELPLSEWRTHNKIVEIRSSDLRFSRIEIISFFEKAVSYSPDENILSRLVKVSEGWISGLRMLILTTRNGEDFKEQFLISNFKNVGVIHQLVDAVLENQSKENGEYLFKLSILKEFNSELFFELCLSEAEKKNRETLFAEFILSITSSNMFIISLDDNNKWYRFHHLFTTILFEGLSDEYNNKKINELRIKVGDWYFGNNQLENAIEYHKPHAFLSHRKKGLIHRSTLLSTNASLSDFFPLKT